MKRIFLLLVPVLMVACSINAQIKMGLIGGINFSDAKQTQLFFTDTESTTNFAVGGVLDYQLTDNFSIKLEPLYIEKGSYGELNVSNFVPAKISLNLSYFEIPVLFKYSVGNTVQPYMFVGPTIGFKLDSDIMLEAGPFEFGIDAGDVLEKLEYSLNIGGGINYQIDELATIFFEAKYVFGLTDIIKKGDFKIRIGDELEHGQIVDGTKYNNRGIQLMLGFTFPLNIN